MLPVRQFFKILMLLSHPHDFQTLVIQTFKLGTVVLIFRENESYESADLMIESLAWVI